MFFLSVIRVGRPTSPFSFLAGVLVVAALVVFLRDRLPGGPASERAVPSPCQEEPGHPDCDSDLVDPVEVAPSLEAPSGPTLDASTVCPGSGYLCARLRSAEAITVRRWKDGTRELTIYVPFPRIDDRAWARRLRQAALRGIRAWNGHPFVLRIAAEDTPETQVRVSWSNDLGGSQIGVAHTRWSVRTGLQVQSIELAVRGRYGTRGDLAARQVQLTAAHEMGHALGLPHSDERRDVMYPTNTATALTARDYRTMEVLYDLPNGAAIR